MKKILALVLAMLLVLGMTSAMAASITLKSGDTHTYRVFEVLTGTLSEADSRQLGNPTWGRDAIDNPGDVNTFISDLTAASSEAAIASLVAAKAKTSTDGRGTVMDGHPLQNLNTGYYVLVDVTDLTAEGFKYDTKSLHVVQVLNDTTLVNIKYDTTTDDKIIVSDSLGTDDAEKDNNPVNGKIDNVSVGDAVNYQITAKVPDTTENFDFFYFIINDTLSKGLTLDQSSIKVYHTAVDAEHLIAADTDTATNANGYTLKVDAADANTGAVSFHIGMKNAKAYNDENIIVTYTATVNSDAVIGEDSNPNTSTVTFSRDPNSTYDGTQDSNNPGFPADGTTPVLGETPITRTDTYTTAIQLQKVDQDGNVLKGAGFTITGDSTEIVLVSSETFTASATGNYYKLTNNTYTTQAPTPENMVDITSENPTAGYVKDSSYTADDKVVFNGETYRPYKPAEDTGKTVYKHILSNEDKYVKVGSNYDMYAKTITYTSKDTTQSVSATQMVGDDGVVIFRGLGAGTYTIEETTTPNGYNTLPSFTLQIDFLATPNTTDADTTNDYHWSVGTNSKTGWRYDHTDGTFKITVENNKGTQLPTTGGVGTTIFYIVGSLLAVAAVILLVTKRRMNANND